MISNNFNLPNTSTMKKFIETRPFLAVIVVFIITLILPFPFVALFKILKLDFVQLRLLIPIVESAFIIILLYKLGWIQLSGFRKEIRNIHLLWLPLVLISVPVISYGTVTISPSDILFYTLAIFFTGVSEEGFARGFGLTTLQSKNGWTAVLFMAFIFGIGHVTNLLFEEFTVKEMGVRLFTLMSFAILYGALFLRTRNIWPLIVMHTLWDMSLVVSGFAGPFMVGYANSTLFEIVIGIISVLYAILIMRNITKEEATV